MDEIRDMQVSNFSKFLDGEVRTNPFGENRSGDRAYRRAERIVAAVYLITNHINGEEPLRKKLRTCALALIENILALRDEMRSSSIHRAAFESTVREMISQIRMLVFGGFVSAQNAESISSALDELGNFMMLSQRTPLSETVRISRDELLDVRDYPKGHLRDIKDKETVRDKGILKDKKETGDTNASTVGIMTGRATTIIDVLRTGGELSIRDIAAHLPEYGEKTIQRELGALIQRGLVRRIGLKRWSRYSIAT